MCSSAPDRPKFRGRWRDLIGQLECGLEVRIVWEAHARTHARMHICYVKKIDTFYGVVQSSAMNKISFECLNAQLTV